MVSDEVHFKQNEDCVPSRLKKTEVESKLRRQVVYYALQNQVTK